MMMVVCKTNFRCVFQIGEGPTIHQEHSESRVSSISRGICVCVCVFDSPYPLAVESEVEICDFQEKTKTKQQSCSS